MFRLLIAAKLRVNLSDHLMCSQPCLAVDGSDNTFETVTGIEILFREISHHSLLF